MLQHYGDISCVISIVSNPSIPRGQNRWFLSVADAPLSRSMPTTANVTSPFSKVSRPAESCSNFPKKGTGQYMTAEPRVPRQLGRRITDEVVPSPRVPLGQMAQPRLARNAAQSAMIRRRFSNMSPRRYAASTALPMVCARAISESSFG